MNTNDGSGPTPLAQPDPVPAVALLRCPELLRRRDHALTDAPNLWSNGLLVGQVYTARYVDDPVWCRELLVVDEGRGCAVLYVDDEWEHRVQVGDLIAFRVWQQPGGQFARIVDYRRLAVA